MPTFYGPVSTVYAQPGNGYVLFRVGSDPTWYEIDSGTPLYEFMQGQLLTAAATPGSAIACGVPTTTGVAGQQLVAELYLNPPPSPAPSVLSSMMVALRRKLGRS